MLAIMGVLFVTLVCLVVADLVGNPALTDLNETRSAVCRWLFVIPFHKLKVPFVVFQVSVVGSSCILSICSIG